MKKEYNSVAKTEARKTKSRALKNPVPYEVAPPSVMMFCEILLNIGVQKYQISTFDVQVAPVALNDGSFGVGFAGHDAKALEECGFRDVDDYNGLRNMLTDLRTINLDPTITIDADNLKIVCLNKLAFHKLLIDFVDEDHHNMTMLDDSTLKDVHGNSVTGRLIDRFRESPEEHAAFYIESGHKSMELGACRPIVCTSREEFYIELLKVESADIPVSMDHLLKTILEEDHRLPESVNRHNFVSGGYN